eukprot:TRINITY_DN5269_c0_g1_i4.p2 TRINITY_DN5269_c0_g1~~TRINITY_DN5269_c0_g1_i4.p2  ORF type:complete len:239 (+),score=89.99 TRINITY_DN5269_c0_g1_i4:175-891(+)
MVAKYAAEFSAEEKEEGKSSQSGNGGGFSEDEDPTVTNARIDAILEQDRLMLFMKGTASEPKCKYSRATVALLEKNSIPFSTYNILEDKPLRAQIKVYKEYPTFPQLYCYGELVGGHDILSQMDADGILGKEIEEMLLEGLHKKIDRIIGQSPVVLFMKGTADEPRCGFSARSVAALKDAGLEFTTYDILADPAVRAEIKVYKDWKTFPQLYVNGELEGGCDIIMEMAETGELEKILE